MNLLRLFDKNEKILLGSLAFVQFSHIIDFIIIMPLGPQLMKIFNITPHQFGLLVSIYTLFAAVSGFLASFIMDRFDRKKTLQFFFLGFTVSTIACGFADSYWVLSLFRAVAGFFGGVLNSVIYAIVSDKIEYSRRGTAMGILSSSFSLASIVGLPAALFLANHFSWHTPFFFLGVLCLFAFLIITIYTPPINGHLKLQSDRFEYSHLLDNLKLFLKTNNQRNSFIFMFFMLFGHFAIVPFISPSLVLNVGFKETDLPLVYFFGGLASVLTGPLIGKMADSIGKHKVFTLFLILSSVPILLVTHFGKSTQFALALVMTSFFFILAGGRMIPAQALVSETVTPDKRGSFMSFISCIQQLSMSAGSYVSGIIITQGATELLNYPQVGYMALVSNFISLWLVWKIRTP